METLKHSAETLEQQHAIYTASQDFPVIRGQLYHKQDGKYKAPRCSDPHEQSPIQKCCRVNTQKDACVHTDPTSAEDTANESSDLTEIDIEDEEVLKEEEVTRVEEEEKEGNEEEGYEEEGNEEDKSVSNDYMVTQCNYSCIKLSKMQPIVGITIMYRVFIIFR